MQNKVLIVEDEILIADSIKRFLTEKGYTVVGIAITYEEAVQAFEDEAPDLVLLDIRLNGVKTGIDVAHFINNHPQKKPFIFLTSQVDRNNIENAKNTFPSGYLSKPIQQESLNATIEVILHSFNLKTKNKSLVRLNDGNTKFLISIEEISFIQAEHVYIRVYRKDGDYILHRSTLKDFLTKLPQDQFIQTHRSFVVNKKHINSWDTSSIYIGSHEIPMSRSKKKEVLELLY